MNSGVVIIDDSAHRAVVLTWASDQQLNRTFLPIGRNFTSALASPDGQTLFVLSAGDWPRTPDHNQSPSLTAITVDTNMKVSETQFSMAEPHSSLAVDPNGDYVVAFHGPNPARAFNGPPMPFAENPNEIVIFPLRGAVTKPVSYTLQSFGSTPQRLTFTQPMNLPAGAPNAMARRLLLVETDLNVKILDLSHFFDAKGPRPEITVPLSTGMTAQQLAPAGLAVDPDDGIIAVRTTSDTNVYLLTLLASPTTANDFNPSINLADVGGIPSDLTFVNTDTGKRVAALVPTKSNAVLIDTTTSLSQVTETVTTTIALPSPYSKLSLVTSAVASACSGSTKADVALLWGDSVGSSGVALWALGVSGCTPYRSVQVLAIADPVQSVDDVPRGKLKILEATASSGGAFFVLNLLDRTAAPLLTTSTPAISIAPDGARVWAYDPNNSTDLASVDLTTLSPIPLTTTLPISTVYDIAGPNPDSKGPRSLIAIHNTGTLGATVFDARNPDTTTARIVPSLLLEGP
jgi:hypothetical protein